MKRWLRGLLICVLCAALAAGSCLAAPSADLAESARRAIAGLKTLKGVRETAPLLADAALLPAGASNSDWIAMALAMQGAAEDYDAYLERLAAEVTQRYATDKKLDGTRATEWHRICLTILALGGDPTAFGQNPDGSPVNLVADGTWQYVNGALDAQGLNGFIYALILLDAGNYAVPEDGKYTRDVILAAILERQNEDGGFGLTVGSSDADVTAMALQALAPYAQGTAKGAVQNALAYLSGVQNADGSFSSGGSATAESTAQVIIALCALGLDPAGAAQFCKPGGSALDALLSFQLDDGSFAHVKGTQGNLVATEQALLALTAAQKYYAGQGRLFDFTDYTPPESVAAGGSGMVLWYVAGAAAAACVPGLVIFALRRRACVRRKDGK